LEKDDMRDAGVRACFRIRAGIELAGHTGCHSWP
jgi:hypothetical protein